MTDWTPEEDEAFNAVERQSNLGKQILRDMGQPYHYDLFVSVSQRNQVLEEAAKACEAMEREAEGHDTECCKWPTPSDCAYVIRGLMK
jgi:hypothetical protein